MMRARRLRSERENLLSDPPNGVYPKSFDDHILVVELDPPADSAFEGLSVKVRFEISEAYPFEPPQVRFLGNVIHPNVDKEGRVCLDVIYLPPQGQWNPGCNLRVVLIQLRQLLAEPGLDDPLMPEIARLYKLDYQSYRKRVRAAV